MGSGCCGGTGWTEVLAGELVALVLACDGSGDMLTGAEPGGGGNGAMPTFLSLAAAAAAADAYLRPSPAGRVGSDAGFMAGPLVLPLLMADNSGVCNVANAGSGDLDWTEPFLPLATSGSFCAFRDAGFGAAAVVAAAAGVAGAEAPVPAVAVDDVEGIVGAGGLAAVAAVGGDDGVREALLLDGSRHGVVVVFVVSAC